MLIWAAVTSLLTESTWFVILQNAIAISYFNFVVISPLLKGHNLIWCRMVYLHWFAVAEKQAWNIHVCFLHPGIFPFRLALVHLLPAPTSCCKDSQQQFLKIPPLCSQRSSSPYHGWQELDGEAALGHGHRTRLIRFVQSLPLYMRLTEVYMTPSLK